MMNDSNGRPIRIIGLAGPKYCGKDTAAKALEAINGVHKKYLFRHAKMAEGVKNIVQEVFGWGPELYEDPILKEQKLQEWPYIEPRWPLMDIANWMRDKYGGDVWARRWERLMLKSNHQWGAHIISDVRFPEEVEMINRYQGIIVYIERPEAEHALAAAQAAQNEMALNRSESHYDMLRHVATHHILNNASTANLEAQIMVVVQHVYEHWKYWPDQEAHPGHHVANQPVANGAV
jgi:hypothetical protein